MFSNSAELKNVLVIDEESWIYEKWILSPKSREYSTRFPDTSSREALLPF